jgi:glycosyltransferase involved in cell wall biosynthesis
MKVCKNIWIFNHYAITSDLPGGTRHFDFAKELTKRGYGVTIFASSFIHGIFKEEKLKRNEKWCVENYDGVNFVWIKTFHYNRNNWRRIVNMLSYSWRAYRIGKKIDASSAEIKKPDVIIGSSVHLFAALTGYKLSTYYKVPFIFEVRDLWPQTLIDLGEISPKHPLVIILKKLEKFLYRKAFKIIVLLPRADEYIVPLGIRKDKIVWISNGVDLKRFEVTKNDSDGKSSFIVLYAGAHGVANGLDTLLESARILKQRHYKNITVGLVGNGPEKARLINKAKQGALDNVFFKDSVKKDEIPVILNTTDVLFSGSLTRDIYKYGISFNKLFDYLAAGKPIIFSSDSSNNPIAEASAGITVPPEDSEAVAEAIIKLYNMGEEERERMGKNGRKYVEKYHSIPVLVDKLEKVIKEVCNELPYK